VRVKLELEPNDSVRFSTFRTPESEYRVLQLEINGKPFGAHVMCNSYRFLDRDPGKYMQELDRQLIRYMEFMLTEIMNMEESAKKHLDSISDEGERSWRKANEKIAPATDEEASRARTMYLKRNNVGMASAMRDALDDFIKRRNIQHAHMEKEGKLQESVSCLAGDSAGKPPEKRESSNSIETNPPLDFPHVLSQIRGIQTAIEQNRREKEKK